MAILLGAARRRAEGRRGRQRELFRQRTGRKGRGGGWGLFVTIVFALAINVSAAHVIKQVVDEARRVEAQASGDLSYAAFARRAAARKKAAIAAGQFVHEAVRDNLAALNQEAERLADRHGTDKTVEKRKLAAAMSGRLPRERAGAGLSALGWQGLPAMLGSLVLLAWSAMLVFGGEGLDLDVQRSRHPMWEWLFSHPAPPGAMFLAEMLAPLAANPVYWFVPIVPGFLYGTLYDTAAGLAAAGLVGLPLLVAAACLGKGLEVLVLLRTSPRARGALIGLMGWLGYLCGALMFLGFLPLGEMIASAAPALKLPASVPWPMLALMLGERPAGGFSFVQGVATCTLVSGATIAGSVALTMVAARQGLSGQIGGGDARPRRQARFGRYAAYRKELIWFSRDRSALVQAVLVPLTMAGFQLFNLRGMLAQAQGRWSFLSGAAVLLGTYFLTVLGPKSLASEGATLWLALTWPLGLESLLKAKARLWAALSSIIVALALGYAVWSYPQAWWKIGLVGLGWALFSIAMAEKSVTLAQVTSSSGEVETTSASTRGRRWAVQLGTLSFAIGVLTENAPLAITGIVYSFLTAAAMWQNFRTHLLFLLDPWSERLPAPPTLMHAMIAIAALVDGGAVAIGIATAFAGRQGAAVALTAAYGLSAAVVSVAMWRFLAHRGVPAAQVWCWPRPGQPPTAGLVGRASTILAGIGGGLALGIVAVGYEMLLQRLPGASHLLHRATETVEKVPHLETAYFAAAVLIAPLAEEYLFRGLLFRALDREWHDWRAVAGSAVFFASYHPFVAWTPVGALGVLNALLFRRTGWLVPAVALHMTYNAVVVGWAMARPG